MKKKKKYKDAPFPKYKTIMIEDLEMHILTGEVVQCRMSGCDYATEPGQKYCRGCLTKLLDINNIIIVCEECWEIINIKKKEGRLKDKYEQEPAVNKYGFIRCKDHKDGIDNQSIKLKWKE